MYSPRFCRFRGGPNGALSAVRFSTACSVQMRSNPPKMSSPPASQDFEPQHPTSSSSPGQFQFDGSAATKRIKDIARSLEQITIAPSTSSSPAPEQVVATASPSPSNPHADAPTRPIPPQGSTSRKSKKKHKKSRKERLEPSAASGGVPNATREYLEASNMVPQFMDTPQNLLVVIDLNGTLLYRPSKAQPTKFLMRPHAQLFLKYCVETFKVVIWSSARPENVTAMCNVILPRNLRGQVAAIWARDKFGLTHHDYNQRVQCYKRLQMLWRDRQIAASHPSYGFGARWDQTNTVLIDDSLEKARSEPHNLIEVPEWAGDLDEFDDILPQVHDHLNYLSQHSNVSACLRVNPFKPRTGETRRSH
jgi:hypothetical protein